MSEVDSLLLEMILFDIAYIAAVHFQMRAKGTKLRVSAG